MDKQCRAALKMIAHSEMPHRGISFVLHERKTLGLWITVASQTGCFYSVVGNEKTRFMFTVTGTGDCMRDFAAKALEVSEASA